jgi:hypothetical protein
MLTCHCLTPCASGSAAALRTIFIAVAAFGLCSCQSPTQTGILAGATGGALIGGLADDSAGGAAIGAVIGGIAGGLAGSYVEYRAERYQPPRQPPPPQEYDQTHVTPLPSSQAPPQYPTARPAEQANRVFSPYPPHNLINTEGFHRGDLAIDPTTNKVFRVP